MKDAAQLRMWRLLARVRQLRVERGRRLLNEARLRVQRAQEETAQQRNAIAEHAVRRREILSACASGDRSASLWRMALHRHDADKSGLVSALAVAQRDEEAAQAKVMSAFHVLQRETVGRDDAKSRLRRLVAAQQDDSDPDD
jgi:hypothetical protein